jgi:hypothetical protein
MGARVRIVSLYVRFRAEIRSQGRGTRVGALIQIPVGLAIPWFGAIGALSLLGITLAVTRGEWRTLFLLPVALWMAWMSYQLARGRRARGE